MPNHYDKILRENISAVILPISKKYFGFEIVETTDLPEKLQVTTGREPDFVKLVKTAAGEEFILHLEYQTSNDPQMIYRMQTYHALLMENFRKEVRQFVIYLGNAQPKMRSQLREKEIMRGFELKNVREIDFRELVNSRIPEEIILAVLGDFKGRDPVAVIRLILQQLARVGQSENEIRKAMQQLGMLSRLRKLDSVVIQESNQMPITYDISKDAFFLKGKLKGKPKRKSKQPLIC